MNKKKKDTPNPSSFLIVPLKSYNGRGKVSILFAGDKMKINVRDIP